MADRTNPSSRRDVDITHSPPEAEVGITNHDLADENENERRMQEHQRRQMSGDAPVGTHEGITLDERDRGNVRDIDTGIEDVRDKGAR